MPYEVNIKETQKLKGNITIGKRGEQGPAGPQGPQGPAGPSFTSFTHEIWTFTLEDDTTVDKDVMLYVNE